MIVGPTANLWVELIDQVGGRHAMCRFDGSSDAIQEGFNILLRRLDEQFPVRISAHVLSEEIKAVLHVRNDSLLRREFKTSFLQKILDQGLISPSSDSFDLLMMTKSSAYRTRLTHGFSPPRDLRRFPAGYLSCKSRSSPSSAQLASAGEIIPPCGVPSVVS